MWRASGLGTGTFRLRVRSQQAELLADEVYQRYSLSTRVLLGLPNDIMTSVFEAPRPEEPGNPQLGGCMLRFAFNS